MFACYCHRRRLVWSPDKQPSRHLGSGERLAIAPAVVVVVVPIRPSARYPSPPAPMVDVEAAVDALLATERRDPAVAVLAIVAGRTRISLLALAYWKALQGWSVEYVPTPNKPLPVCSNFCAWRFAVIAAYYAHLRRDTRQVFSVCSNFCAWRFAVHAA